MGKLIYLGGDPPVTLPAQDEEPLLHWEDEGGLIPAATPPTS